MKNKAIIEIIKIGFIVTGISILNESCNNNLSQNVIKNKNIYITKSKKNLNQNQIFKSKNYLDKTTFKFLHLQKNKFSNIIKSQTIEKNIFKKDIAKKAKIFSNKKKIFLSKWLLNYKDIKYSIQK